MIDMVKLVTEEQLEFSCEPLGGDALRLSNIHSQVLPDVKYGADVTFVDFDGDYAKCDITVLELPDELYQANSEAILDEVTKCYVHVLSEAITQAFDEDISVDVT
jgi:hypothetical protein